MRPFGIFWKRWPASGIDMSIFLLNGFLLLGFVVATVPDVLVLGAPSPSQIMDQGSTIKKCRVMRNSYSLLEAQCSSLELEGIPTYLNTGIQVLDVTKNRLRELTNDSLLPYKSLEYIYLADNFVQTIEEAAFANQHYLQVLDFTKNGCDNLPKSLFQLSHLRTLYLDDNKFADSVFKVPVSSPLSILQLNKNKLTKIPDLDVLPTLKHLNISDNLIVSISSEDIAPFCSLKVLDLSKNPIKFSGGGCECHALEAWLKLRRVEVKHSFKCSDFENAGRCTNVQFSNRTHELYDKCLSVIQLKVETEKARSAWIMVVSCVSVFIVCVFIALFCVHKRNRRRRRKQKQQQQQQLAANNANTELLNSNLTPGNS